MGIEILENINSQYSHFIFKKSLKGTLFFTIKTYYEMPKNHNPHDKFIRKILSKRKAALEYIKNFVPESIVKNLDLRSMKMSPNSYVDEKLEEYISDLVYICNWKSKGEKTTQVRISFLIEHKSYIPKYPHLQLLRYLLEAWEQDIEEKRSLTLTIPIILYHGKKKWKHRKFEDYFNLPDDILKPFVPNFDYLLTDLSKISDEEILAIGANYLANTLLVLKHSWDGDYILRNGRKIFQYAEVYVKSEEGRIFIQIIQIYIFQIVDFDKKRLNLYKENLPKLVNEILMSTYDMLIQQGEEKGIEKGIGKVISSLILKKPKLTDKEIAEMTSVSISIVRKIRNNLNK